MYPFSIIGFDKCEPLEWNHHIICPSEKHPPPSSKIGMEKRERKRERERGDQICVGRLSIFHQGHCSSFKIAKHSFQFAAVVFGFKLKLTKLQHSINLCASAEFAAKFLLYPMLMAGKPSDSTLFLIPIVIIWHCQQQARASNFATFG